MSSSEIITNIDNSIYHLHLKPGQLSTDIILVGDPDRVDSISKYFDTIEFVIQNREFKSVTGSFNNKRISVISTGIGGSNIDIVINEVDALFNYDFTNQCYKTKHESLNFIRIGTSGSISENIEVNSHLISEYAIDLNSQLSFYNLDNYKSDNIDLISFENLNLNCFRSSRELFEKFYSNNLVKGLTFEPWSSICIATMLQIKKFIVIIFTTTTLPYATILLSIKPTTEFEDEFFIKS